jgi:GT2 family glycosyltransferase
VEQLQAVSGSPLLRPGVGPSSAEVTVVVVPRERFRVAPQALAQLIATADLPYHLIYVDGGSPPPVAEALREAAQAHGFQRIRRDGFLVPNAARNLGLAQVTTPYAIFVDNDVMFEPGWLSAMVGCARETGAGLVTPVTLQGDPGDIDALPIHFAGGRIEFVKDAGRQVLRQVYDHEGVPYGEVAAGLARRETGCVEFHCVLARTAALRAAGGFDESLFATSEHFDISLEMKRLGETIYLEPRAIAVNDITLPLDASERGYFCLRWSDGWWRPSERAFQRKWNLAAGYTRSMRGFIRDHRLYAFPYRRMARYLGWRPMVAIVNVISETLAWLNRGRAEPLPTAGSG